MRALLESGADPSIQDLDGYTALRLALDRGYGDVADCLNPAGDDRAFGIGRACDTAREMPCVMQSFLRIVPSYKRMYTVHFMKSLTCIFDVHTRGC